MAGPLADRIGRKWSISFWCIILHVGLIIQISSPHPKWYQFMMGRFVTGFGVGACSLLGKPKIHHHHHHHNCVS
jgi:SP family sugar:H+ symporter-like MFS transporter